MAKKKKSPNASVKPKSYTRTVGGMCANAGTNKKKNKKK